MRKLALGVALSCALIGTGAAVAQESFGVDPYVPSLYRFDDATATVNDTQPLTLAGETVLGGTGLTQHPLTDVYYAILRIDGQVGRELVTVDPTTGVSTSVGNTGDSFAGITFDSSGTLYGVTGDGAAAPETLWTLSTLDGSATFVLTLGNGNSGEAIVYNPDDGFIYHMSGVGTLNDPIAGRIFERIDPVGLTVTPIPITSVNLSETLGMKYKGGGLILFSTLSQELWQTTITGTEAFVATFPETAFVRGFAPVDLGVPADSPLSRWATGLLLLLVISFAVWRKTVRA